MTTSTQVVKTMVTLTENSPFLDYSTLNLDNQTTKLIKEAYFFTEILLEGVAKWTVSLI